MNVIKLAKDAGFTVSGGRIETPYIGGSDIGQRLKEFAALVRAEALEEAARVAEETIASVIDKPMPLKNIVAAIRGLK